ncbi:ABC transporter ATP-binding protein [Parenemella sanctibonifatiensis]|uniref:Multidrug ABC transporter ATP-binding protein n=1 Tax=Parenemella sanctibonifatiensis TaxID=2016505 RepID=A0A255E9R0_9ACTN|nr:ABC transporter ATP-binding protein [Parenemella sanctibonifatiensis]OYN88307.1 multidrug ABC transporter ATP-binding protein [Parenemella sanctibonifatiensis]
MESAVLDISGLTRRFGTVVANDAVDLQVRRGEVVGLLGHNGAGKTTLVSQIVGLLRPDKGAIRVAGIDAVAHPARARRSVALQGQAQAPLDGLTPRSAVEISARLRGLSRPDARAAASALAEELDLAHWWDQRAGAQGSGLSGGIRRLTAFAMAAVAPVPLLVLDEPTNDVDALRRRRLWEAVRRIGDQGAGVLLVTHNVAEAERVVDRLVVLDAGRVVAAGTPAAIRGAAADSLRLELTLVPGGADPSEGDLPVPTSRRVLVGRRALLTIASAEAAAAVAWATRLREDGLIDGYALAPVTLEDAYLALTHPPTLDPAVEANHV